MLDVLLPALALVFVVEGLGPMLFPNKWRNFMMMLADKPAAELRTMGGVMVVVGLVSLIFWL